MIYFDQIFDDMFNDFFRFPDRTLRLLDQAVKTNSVSDALPSYPVSNLYVDENGTSTIELAVPGFQKSEIKVQVTDNILTIEGSHTDEIEPKGRRYICRKLAKRSFKNSYKLISASDADNIGVSLNNGLLTISIPLKEEEKRVVKQLEIK